MSWRIGNVQNTTIGMGFPVRPGFTLQQDGYSPSLTLVFEDEETANECADLMQTIFDKASGIRGRD